jgi:polysaccharide biosynthesis/export protein
MRPSMPMFLALLERLNAAGLTVSQLQSSIQKLLPTKVFPRRTDDGREYPVLLTADEVTLSVAEYSPVYVNGDVAKPGQQTFRPGLPSARLGLQRHAPRLESADLRAEYMSL